MQLFYAPHISDDRATLDEEEMLHCTRTLRKREGDSIHLTDGKGHLWLAHIQKIEKKQVLLSLQTPIEHPARANQLHIAIAPTKNIDRIEFFLEKATEIGINQITLLRCQRSERREARADRLEKIIHSAAKQSLQLFFPVLNPLVDFSEFIRQDFKNSTNFIAHCQTLELPHFAQICPQHTPVTLLIGPEGDFSDAEITAAHLAGFIAVSLGTSRLRTETAGIAACVWANTP